MLISDLSDDCLLLVFTRVPPLCQLSVCVRVCRRWRSLCKSLVSVGPFRGRESFSRALRFVQEMHRTRENLSEDVLFYRHSEFLMSANPLALSCFKDFLRGYFLKIERASPLCSPTLLGLCPNLRSLELTSTFSLNPRNAAILEKITSLRELRLCDFGCSSLRLFRNNKNLTHLCVCVCPDFIDLAQVTRFKELRTLRYISPPGVSPLLPPYDISGLKHIYHLEIVGVTEMTDAPLASLCGLRGLTYVNLSQNPNLTVKCLGFLRFNTRIQYLDVSFTSVEHIVPVIKCRYLETLLVDGTRVTRLTPATYCRRLRLVSATMCNLTEESVAAQFLGRCPLAVVRT